MPHTCTPCEASFNNPEALNQHLESQVHASRLPADRLQLDQKSATVPTKSDGMDASKLTPSSPDSSEFDSQNPSQPPQQMAIRSHVKVAGIRPPQVFHCDTCNKSFKNKDGLRSHIRDSTVHNSSVQSSIEVATTTASQTPTTAASLRTQIPLPDGTTLSPDVSSPEKSQSKEHSWSKFPDTELPAVLESLLVNCHTLQDLQSSKYLTRPYDDKTASVPKSNSKAAAKPAPDYKTFAISSAPSPEKPAYQAIALDCEMVKVMGPKKELVLVCAINYLTGAVLMNKLVAPAEEVIDWKTRIHGISASSMAAAVAEGVALIGWEAAREELWKLIDQDTIIVGHALQHDLNVLHMIHTRIVDSAILTCNAIGMGANQMGLKVLAQELLGVEIRNDEGGGVHDCLEDVFATREVVLWCTRNTTQLEDWAVLKRSEIRRQEEDRKAAKRKPNSRKP